MLTLEDIERRAKARGWEVLHDGRAMHVLTDHGGITWARKPPFETGDASFYLVSDVAAQGPRALHLRYLLGLTEAREGAARVLSVVAQVAAMQCAALLQADMVRALSSISDALEQQAADWCTEARELRREVLRLRHRLRSRNDCHPSGDRLRPEDIDALLCRGLWGEAAYRGRPERHHPLPAARAARATRARGVVTRRLAAWRARAEGDAAMTIDRSLIERRARQASAWTVVLSLPKTASRHVRDCVARYRWRQMRIAVHSCERWAHVQDRLTARWLIRKDDEDWDAAGIRRHVDRPICGPVGRLP